MAAAVKVEQRCWGCDTLLSVPIDSQGKLAPAFKCAICAAVNDEKTAAAASASKPVKSGWIGWIVVGFVWFMFALVIGLGVVFMLPEVFPKWTLLAVVNYGITFVLGSQVVVNYYATVTAKNLPMPSLEDVKVSYMSQPPEEDGKGQVLADWSMCHRCNVPRPPRSRHCSTCNTCVQRMDHHCMYTNRCVGLHNHAPFLRFVFWLVTSTFYVMIVAAISFMSLKTKLALLPRSPTLMSSMQQTIRKQGLGTAQGFGGMGLMPGMGPMMPNVPAMIGHAISNMPMHIISTFMDAGDLMWPMVATVAEFVIGLIVTMMVGGLLISQGRNLYLGVTEIESWGGSRGKGSWENYKEVFGNSHPVLWLLPLQRSAKAKSILKDA